MKTLRILLLSACLLFPVSPVRAQFGQSMGIFWQDMDATEQQMEFCYDWFTEVCLARMMEDIPNWGGLNNLIFCWRDGCLDPHVSCNACEGTCAVGIDLPDWMGAKPKHVYFIANFAAGVEEAMKAHNQWWTQDAEWQDGRPCYASPAPIPPGTPRVKGMYGRAATIPGWGSIPQPDWEDLLGTFEDRLRSDALLVELAAGLIYLSNTSASAGNALAMKQRVLVMLLGYLYASGQWHVPTPAPDRARGSVPTEFTAGEWLAMAYAAEWVYVGEFTTVDPTLVGFPSRGYPEAMVELIEEIHSETCVQFGDCDWVPVRTATWGGIKTRYRKENER